ncbi:MAG TPA: GNAT family N-acetyltransferase [Acetobacteraceae bacterium]|nr:GNAT family N-acetyltransferase [Acetobacteraceae bacterium]
MAGYPAELVEHWEGAGEPMTIRPIRPDDAPAHEAFFHRLSPEDVRFRFFAAIRELSPEQLRRFTRPDYERDIAFVAVREATGETVGVARLARTEIPGVAEFAVVVQPDMRDHGLGRHLMQRLIDWAPAHGIAEIRGEVLAENANMLSFCRSLGFTLSHIRGNPETVQALLKLPPARTHGAAS